MKGRGLKKFVALVVSTLLTLQMTVPVFADADILEEPTQTQELAEESTESKAIKQQKEPSIPDEPADSDDPEESSKPEDSELEDSSEPDDSSESEDSSKSEAPSKPDETEPEESRDFIILTDFDPLPDSVATLVIEAGTPKEAIPFPDSLGAVSAGGESVTVEGITWDCPAYPAQSQAGQAYSATAVLPEGYQPASGVSLPEIHLMIDGPVLNALNDRIYLNGIEYKEINGTQVQVVGYTSDFSGAADIPATVTRDDGQVFDVISIEAYAFQNCDKITSLNTGDGVKTIGKQAFEKSKVGAVTFGPALTRVDENAFAECASLHNITIPPNVQVLSNVFLDSGLQSVIVESGVTDLWDSVFASCSALSKVTLPEGLKVIGARAFNNCKSLKEIALPSSVEILGFEAFHDTGLTKFVMPDAVKATGASTFANCPQLTDFTFSANIQEISERSFENCIALDVDIPSTVTAIQSQAFYNSGLTKAIIPANAQLSANAFINAYKLSSVTLPEGMTTVPPGVFCGCSKLRQITLPSTIREIGPNAFARSGLTTINFPPALESIRENAFAYTSLSEVTLSNVTFIGKMAFYHCSSLTKLTIHGNNAKLEENIINDCSPSNFQSVILTGTFSAMAENAFAMHAGTFTITVPDTETASMVCDTMFDLNRIIIEDGGALPSPKTFVDGPFTYVIGNGTNVEVLTFNGGTSTPSIPEEVTFAEKTYRVTGIRKRAFYEQTLTSVSIPDSVTVIGDEAFQKCSNLQSVTMGSNLTSIGAFAFADCSALNSISLPDSLEQIGARVFMNTGIKALAIPPKIKSLSGAMAYECKQLTTVSFKGKPERIEWSAFYGAVNLKDIVLPDSINYIGPNAFGECSQLQEIEFPASLTTLESSAFAKCASLKAISIPQGLSYLSSDVFRECTSLETVTFPSAYNLFSIHSCAFFGCSKLKSVTIPDGTSQLSMSVFDGCTSLKTVKLPQSLTYLGHYAFRNTALTQIEIPDNVTHILEECFWNCSDLGVAFIGSGVQTIGIRAFPKGTQLFAQDPRVQLLLVEYLSQNEDARPQAQWDGQSNLPAASVAAAASDLTITGDISIAKGAKLTVYKTITVRGHLRIDGEVILADGAAVIITGNGRADGFGIDHLPLCYTVGAATAANGSISTEKAYYPSGSRVEVTVKPDAGYRLKPGSLKYGDTEITRGSDQKYSFMMPDQPITITAAFDTGVTIDGPTYPILMDGKSLSFSVEFPQETDTTDAAFLWTAEPAGAVVLDGADTGTVTVTPAQPVTDQDVTLSVQVQIGESSLTAAKTLRVSTMRGVVIQENPKEQFRPGRTFQLTALSDQGEEVPGGIDWSSSDESVAAVNAAGTITFLGVGDASITAVSTADNTLRDSRRFSVVLDVQGVVMFPDETPGAYKSVTVSGGTLSAAKTLSTDDTGAFTAESLGVGSYTVKSDPHQGAFQEASKTFAIVKGDGKAEWALTYGKAADDGTVTYAFTNSAGNPVRGVRAEIHTQTPYQYQVLYSDNDGKVVFSDLRYALTGTVFTVSYATTDGAAGTEKIELKSAQSSGVKTVTLPTQTSVSGKLVNSAGTGIADLYVSIGSRGGYTDADGQYTISGQWENGTYPVLLGDGQGYFYAAATPSVTIQSNQDSYTISDTAVTKGIDVIGSVRLDGGTQYQKAYVSLYDESNKLIASGYGTPEGGYALPGAVKKTGTYTLKITQIFDTTGWYSVDYTAEPLTFEVTDLLAERISKELTAKAKLQTAAFFRGEGNVLATSAMLVQENGKFDLTIKYQNNGDRAVTASFETSIINGGIDPAFLGGDYGSLQHVATLQPHESGRYLIKAIAGSAVSGNQAISVETKVTIDGETYDFARLGIDVANITLSAKSTSIKTGDPIQIYGEAPESSKVEVRTVKDNALIGNTQISDGSGKWFSMELPPFNAPGDYAVYATAEKGSSVYLVSSPLTFHVSADPVTLKRVKADHLAYNDLPINERVGVRSFTHMVDNSLVPDPLTIRAEFTGNVTGVTYQFAGKKFPAKKDSQGLWSAGINGWRGTGLQQMTAAVTANGAVLDFTVAEVIVLIDPSGCITDGDTGKPLVDAEVTCYVQNSDGSYTKFDTSAIAAGPNPMRTDAGGRYGWMVPAGIYKISAAKDGFVVAESGEIAEHANGIKIPPPALDVNLALPPATAMELTSLTGSGSNIYAKFSRYVQDGQATVTDGSGTPIPVTVTADKDTLTLTGNLHPGVLYTVALKDIQPKSGGNARFGLPYATGTVKLSGSGGGQPDTPISNSPSTGGSSGGSGGSSSSGRSPGGSIFSNLISRVSISPSAIRKAARVGSGAVAKLTGDHPRTAGADLAKALGALNSGESLILRKYTGKKVAYQFQIDPLKLTTLPKNLDFSLWTDSRACKRVEKSFEKYFTNSFVTLQTGQEGSFGFQADIAVKLDLSNLKVDSLRVYRYNETANSYQYLPDAFPYRDQNGFLHLSLKEGGMFLITDKEWEKKQ